MMAAFSFRVLLVDDELDFVEALAERMRTRGVSVDSAQDGQEALEKIRGRAFDAIILDLAMPGIDGLETLRRMREYDPDLQIVLLTGQASVAKGVEAIKLGALDFLEKPASIDVLMDKVREAAGRKMAVKERRSEEQIAEILKRMGW
jgi:DNA-binding NtrC family response regulator